MVVAGILSQDNFWLVQLGRGNLGTVDRGQVLNIYTGQGPEWAVIWPQASAKPR